MQENPPRSPFKIRSRKDSSRSTESDHHPRKNNNRFTFDESASDTIDCSGEYCGSCATSLMADCVAVCCCPLALVSLLALAFVKVPYLVGRRCWRRRKKKKRKCNKIETSSSSSMSIEHDMVVTRKDVSSFSGDIVFVFGEEEALEERKSFCAAFEADRVLMELYQVGHLGFGRVSFTGIHSFGQGK